MNLQTFRAATMAEALTQVKASMGTDAVILHTRTFHTRHFLGLRRREMVEITAGKGINVTDRRRAAPTRPAQQPQATLTGPAAYRANGNGNGNGVKALPASHALSQSNNTRTLAESSRQLLETPAANSAAILGLTKEMGSLRAMVQDLVQFTRHQKTPEVPQELFDYYLLLVENEVEEELATEVVKALQKQIRPEHLSQPSYVRDRLADQLEKLITVSGPIRRNKSRGPHVVALVGPTGVGKTTTLAKLAANLKLREKHRVGLITLDTYRIAAVEQLRRYADIIGSPLRVVQTGEDLQEAMRSMADCDFVLIDTAGRSPTDAMKLNELRSLLASINPDEVHLVMSATTGERCMTMAAEKFGEVRVDKVIFTKIDEAAHVGCVFNILRKIGKSLSYITTGQDVPDDIEDAKGKRLAQLILGSGL